MSLGQKMSAESNATRNQTGNMSGAVNNVTQSAEFNDVSSWKESN